ncbi:MAG TPA: VanZ family protein [Pseudonocardiaceae bacterium]|nr:VanZ family protein [Pseudonocardiaceae bacterium]
MFGFLTSAGPSIGLAENMLSRPAVFAAEVFGAIVLGVLAWLIAGRLGWIRWAAVLAAAGLAMALAVTLVRHGGHLPTGENPLYRCVSGQFSLHSETSQLNFLMLMPYAFFGTIATRRPFTIAISSAVLSACVEITQALTGLGVCDKQDFLNNTIGALIVVAVAWFLLFVTGSNGPRRRTETVGPRDYPADHVDRGQRTHSQL